MKTMLLYYGPARLPAYIPNMIRVFKKERGCTPDTALVSPDAVAPDELHGIKFKPSNTVKPGWVLLFKAKP